MTNELIDRLAREITLTDREPSDSLMNALTQLEQLICEGTVPEFPVDWAKVIADAVQTRHRV